MFRFDAFGRRIICNPRLVFVKDNDGGGGGDDTAARVAAEAAAFLTENGFPQKTKVEDMEPLQQAAYWHDQSKKQQKKADEHADYDDLKAKADRLEQLEKENLSDQEKALEAAREEARREGENIGSERYLRDAVTARFQFLTGKSDEDVATAFDVVDPKKFLDDKGEILAEKLKAFADTFGAKDQQQTVHDPIRSAIERQRQGGGAASSISERRKQTRESMTKKTA